MVLSVPVDIPIKRLSSCYTVIFSLLNNSSIRCMFTVEHAQEADRIIMM